MYVSNFYPYLIPYVPRVSGFGGLGVACRLLVPKFAGSNPAEAVGFLLPLPSEGK